MKTNFGSCFAFSGGMIPGTPDTARKSIFSNEELIIQLKSGNEEAFSQLYDRYSPALLYSIHRMVRDKVKAENILQSVFETVVQTIHDYSPRKASLFSWMSLIARNEALNFIKDQQGTGPVQPFSSGDDKINYAPAGRAQPDRVGKPAQKTIPLPLQRVMAELYSRGFSSSEIDLVLVLQS